MQENIQEKLDKLFPNGYVIIYTCPDNQIRCAMYNPNLYKQLEDYHDLITTEWNEL